MRDEEVFFTLMMPLVIVGIAFFYVRGRQRNDLRKKRLQVLDDALRHPALDDAVRQHILTVLADEHVRASRPLLDRLRPWTRVAHGLWIAAAWTLMIGGLLTWGYSEMVGFSWRSVEPCLVSAITGFIMLTMPIAVREGLSRGHKPVPARQ